MAGLLDVGLVVGDAENRFASFSNSAKDLHDFMIGMFVQSGGGLIDEKQVWFRDDFVGQAGPFDLASRQVLD